MQVYEIDNNNFYTGKGHFVEEPSEYEITTPCNTSTDDNFYKPKWNFELKKWIEGWTAEEIKAWEDSKQIDILPQPTLADVIAENKLLNAQVDALSANQDFYEECIVEIASLVYA